MSERHDIHADHPRDGDPVTLAEAARLLSLSSDKAVYVARRRHQLRVEAGSVEDPFPEPVSRSGRAHLFRFGDVRVWLQGHTRLNNPRSKGRSK